MEDGFERKGTVERQRVTEGGCYTYPTTMTARCKTKAYKVVCAYVCVWSKREREKEKVLKIT